jgi:hypothetical protein
MLSALEPNVFPRGRSAPAFLALSDCLHLLTLGTECQNILRLRYADYFFRSM